MSQGGLTHKSPRAAFVPRGEADTAGASRSFFPSSASGLPWGAAPTPWGLRVGCSGWDSPLPAPQVGFPAPWEDPFPSSGKEQTFGMGSRIEKGDPGWINAGKASHCCTPPALTPLSQSPPRLCPAPHLSPYTGDSPPKQPPLPIQSLPDGTADPPLTLRRGSPTDLREEVPKCPLQALC